MKLKRTVALLLCGVMLLTGTGITTLTIPANAVTAQATQTKWPSGPKKNSLSSDSAIVMELSTGTILYEKNSHKKHYPASITKILTALLAAENSLPSDTVKFSKEAAYGISSGDSTVYSEPGEKMSMEQCLYAIMLESANEVCLAAAEHVSGSVKNFVNLMNKRVKKLGLKDTHFNNPNGLPDETHVTTANDMAKIAKAAWQNATCRKFFTTDLYEIPPTNVFTETRYLLNHHKMMAGRDYAYDGVLGGKTGYTDAAGATLVTYAKRGNMLLVAVVMNSVNGAWSDTKSLLDYGFDNFERQRIKVSMNPVPKENLPSEQYLLNNCGNTYPFYYTKNIYVTVPIGTDVKTLTRKQRVLSNAVGPLRLKSKYYFNGQMVGWGMQYERSILANLLTVPGA